MIEKAEEILDGLKTSGYDVRGEGARKPYTLHFLTPDSAVSTWTQFHESREAASEAFSASLAREYPDGKGGTAAAWISMRAGNGEPRHLTCCCCGGDAGTWKQHWNRDTGYGVCPDCIANLRAKGMDDEQIRSYYGTEGVNFGGAA